MTETPPIQKFNAGELSPRLRGRTDLDFNASGCRFLQNFLVSVWGDAVYRGGTRYLFATADSAYKPRLVPFQYRDTIPHALEFGEYVLRPIVDRAQPVVESVSTAISNGSFTSNITGWSDISTGSGAISWNSTLAALNLNAGGTGSTDIGWAEQSVSVAGGDQAKLHVLRFRVIGDDHDRVTARVGTSTGTSGLALREDCAPGWHTLTFTPGTGTVYVSFAYKKWDKNVQVDDVGFHPAGVLELMTPYSAADVALFRTTQSADVLFIARATIRPHAVKRFGTHDWSVEVYELIAGPFETAVTDEDDEIKINDKDFGPDRTVTARQAIFAPTDVGRSLQFKDGSDFGWGRIVGYTSPTVVTVDVITSPDVTNDTYFRPWAFGRFSDTTGWPTALTFHQQRLILVSNPDGTFPRLNGSASGDFPNFQPGTNDADAISYAVVADDGTVVQDVVGGTRLAALTTSTEFAFQTEGVNAALTPTNASASPVSIEGAAPAYAIKAHKAILFIAEDRRRLIELTYDLKDDGQRPRDLSLRSEHITKASNMSPAGGLALLAWQRRPNFMAWAAREDGYLIGCLYFPDESALGWGRYPIGGTFGDDAYAHVESMCAVRAAGRTDLYLATKRTIDGSTARYVEVLEDPLEADAPQEDSFNLDCGLTLDNTIAATLTPAATTGEDIDFVAGSSVFVVGDVGRFIKYRYIATTEGDDGLDTEDQVIFRTAVAEITAYTSGTEVTATIHRDFPSTAAIAAGAWRMTVTSLSGLDHLEGETIAVVGDGAIQADQVVTSGEISLEAPAATVHVGYRYRGILEPLPPDVGSRQGTAHGKRQRVHQIDIRFLRSLGGEYGQPHTALEQIPGRTTIDPMDTTAPLFTGIRSLKFPGNWTREARVRIEQNLPLPMQVQMIIPHSNVGET